jgi:hypothetical protein
LISLGVFHERALVGLEDDLPLASFAHGMSRLTGIRFAAHGGPAQTGFGLQRVGPADLRPRNFPEAFTLYLPLDMLSRQHLSYYPDFHPIHRIIQVAVPGFASALALPSTQ